MEMHPMPKAYIPWHTVHIDISGKLSGKNNSKEYVKVKMDAFTKYVFLHHTFGLDTVNAAISSISIFGVPNRIIAEQGRSFASVGFRNFCLKNKIDFHLIATGASRANGQVQRVITLNGMLTAKLVNVHDKIL